MTTTSSDGELDLGHNVFAEIRRVDGVVHGVYYEHTCLGRPRSPGWVPVKPEWKDGWDLVSEKPLTLAPSLLCRLCGHHGFIRDGKWVPA